MCQGEVVDGADGKKVMTGQKSARMRRVGSGKGRVTLETAGWMARKAVSIHSEHCRNWRPVQQQFGALG